MKNHILLFFLLVCIIPLSQAQSSNTDSLKRLLKTLPENQEKVDVLHQLCYSIYESDLPAAFEYVKKAMEIARKINFRLGIANSYNRLGMVCRAQGDYLNAIKNYQRALKIHQKLGNTEKTAMVENNMGIIYVYQGRYLQAGKCYIKALKIYEKLGGEVTQKLADTYNNLAILYKKQKKNKQAIEAYGHAIVLYERLSNAGVMKPLYNLGMLYFDMEQYTKALSYFQKSLELSKQLENKRMEVFSTIGIGRVYLVRKQYDNALQFLLIILDKATEPYNQSYAYRVLAEVYMEMEQYDFATQYAQKSLKITEKINRPPHKIMGLLSTLHERLGNYQQSLFYYKTQVAIKDSIFNERINQQLTEMEVQYETEKKERENQRLRHEQLIKDLTIQRQYTWTITTGGLLFFMVLFTCYLYYHNQQKKKSNRFLAYQKQEIELQNEEILQQSDEIATQRDYIQIQNEELKSQHQQIKDSIFVAENIQKAMLPLSTQFEEKFKDHFIIYNPKDIVSGDFYWLSSLGSTTYLAVVDCTGHGVPGALMSMTGQHLLHEILHQQKITDLTQIVQRLHESILHTFRNHTRTHNIGMEIALCAFTPGNQETTQIEYVGTKRPMYYFEDGKLQIIKGCRVSVGDKQKPTILNHLNYHKLMLSQNTMFYLTTDGLVDTPNPQRMRFGTKQLLEVLTEIGGMPPVEQKDILLQKIKAFQRDTPQRDDVTVIGVKI